MVPDNIENSQVNETAPASVRGGDVTVSIRKPRQVPQGLAIMIVVLALLTLVLMIILIAATQNRVSTNKTSDAATTTTEASSTVETVAAIDIVKATDYMTENASAASLSTASATEVDVPSTAPAAAHELLADTRLTGVDEDVAVERAKAAGFTPYSVYVFKTDAVTGSAALPDPGLVLKWSPYFGRVRGELFACFYVQTSESVSSAVAVPNVTGMPWEDARQVLASAGINARFEYEQDSPDTYGTVLFQAPSAGTYMPKGSSAVLILAD